MLGYYPTNNDEDSDKYRKIKQLVVPAKLPQRQKLQVRARAGYYVLAAK